MTQPLLGEAWIRIRPLTTGFAEDLDAETAAATDNLEKDMGQAGENAGANLRGGVRKGVDGLDDDLQDVGNTAGLGLRTGVKDGAKGLEDDLGELGALGGTSLRAGVKEGASGIENDLADVGMLGGGSLRRGVTEETGKLADDLERDGTDAGGRFSRGISTGFSKLGSVIENTGLPLGGLSSGLDKAGESVEGVESRSSGLVGTLDKVGKVALIAGGVGLAGMAVEGVRLATTMQTADTQIATAAGTSVKAATSIGDAFLDLGGKSEFSGEKIAQAYASVAGVLHSTEGHALSTAQSLTFMNAVSDLAVAKQIDLGDAAQTTAGVLQAFELPVSQTAHVTDVLLQASDATGQSIDTLGTTVERVRSKLGPTSGSVGDLAGLLVDMTDHGVTGRAAITGLSTGMTTLQKTAEGVQTAVAQQNAAYAQMSPSLRALADQYRTGAITSKQFTDATEGLPANQAALATAFATASTAVDTARQKYAQLGVTVFNSQGQFVGMGSIIQQLAPKFAGMTQQQQLATASTLFGASAAKQMVAVIQAGPAAYDAATASVNKMGTAHAAAAAQAKTLHGEEDELGAEVEDLTTKFGQVLLPVLTSVGRAFLTATNYVLSHKAVLIALGVVVGGVLTTAITVFTVNKMVAFGQSFDKATTSVGKLATSLKNTLASAFSSAGADADAAGAKIEGLGATTTSTASVVETQTAAIDGDLEGVGASAGTMATAVTTGTGTVEADVATMATDVTTADTTIETENKAVKTSFLGVLGEVGLVVAAIEGYNALAPNFNAQTGKDITGFTSAAGAAGLTPAQNRRLQGQFNTIGTGIEGADWSQTGRRPPYASDLQNLIKTATADLTEFSKTGKSSAFDSFTSQAASVLKQWNIAPVKTSIDQLTKVIQQAQADAKANAKASTTAAATSFSTSGNWANTLLSSLGVKSSPGAVTALEDWQAREGPFGTQAAYNPLNVSGPLPGTGKFDGTPAENYASPSAGIAGEDAYLKQYGPGVIAALATGNVATIEKAVHDLGPNAFGNDTATPWAGSSTSVAASGAPYGNAGKPGTYPASAPSSASTTTAAPSTGTSPTTASSPTSVKTVAEKVAEAVTAAHKKAAEQMAADTKAGTAQLDRLVTAAHATSLASIRTDLNSTHTAAMNRVVTTLLGVHTTKMTDLADRVVVAYDSALNRQTTLVAQAEAKEVAQQAAAQAAWVKSIQTIAATALSHQDTLIADQAKASASAIADATTTSLDQQAEAGLTGADLVAAQAQVSYDQVAQATDAVVNAATVAVDKAASGNAFQQAQAAQNLAQAQAAQTTQEAQAQSTLDIAKAAATAADNAASTTAAAAGGSTSSTPTPPAPVAPTSSPTFILNVYGAGLTPAQLMDEINYQLTIGGLPAATADVPVV